MQTVFLKQLLDCPFCGGAAEFRQFAIPKNYYKVRCSMCGCETYGYDCLRDATDDENKLIQAAIWNRRAEVQL